MPKFFQVLSHEVAHNLGARNRIDGNFESADGRPCFVKGYFMRSYSHSPDTKYRQWSPCSAEEILAYLHKTINKYGRYCMPQGNNFVSYVVCLINVHKKNTTQNISLNFSWGTTKRVIPTQY